MARWFDMLAEQATNRKRNYLKIHSDWHFFECCSAQRELINHGRTELAYDFHYFDNIIDILVLTRKAKKEAILSWKLSDEKW